MTFLAPTYQSLSISDIEKKFPPRKFRQKISNISWNSEFSEKSLLLEKDIWLFIAPFEIEIEAARGQT